MLRKDRNKRIILVLIVIIAVVLVATVAFLLIKNIIKDDNGDEIIGIQVSYVPKSEYYVGEAFVPEGTLVQVVTKDTTYAYVVDYYNVSFTGFDSAEPNDELPITVTYKGFTTTFTVKIKEIISAVPVLERIEISDNFKTTYDETRWNEYGPSIAGVTLKLIYSDGSVVENIPLKHKYIFGYTNATVGTTEIIIKYSDGTTLVELPITITITE